MRSGSDPPVSRAVLFLVVESSVSVVVFSVVVVDFTEYFAGGADGEDIGGDVSGYDAACTDYGVFSDGYTCEYDGSCTDPDVIFDGDGKSVHSVKLVSQQRLQDF